MGTGLIALKGNRRALHAAVRDWFDTHAFAVGGKLWPCSDTWDDQHGRLAGSIRSSVYEGAGPCQAEAWTMAIAPEGLDELLEGCERSEDLLGSKA